MRCSSRVTVYHLKRFLLQKLCVPALYDVCMMYVYVYVWVCMCVWVVYICAHTQTTHIQKWTLKNTHMHTNTPVLTAKADPQVPGSVAIETQWDHVRLSHLHQWKRQRSIPSDHAAVLSAACVPVFESSAISTSSCDRSAMQQTPPTVHYKIQKYTLIDNWPLSTSLWEYSHRNFINSENYPQFRLVLCNIHRKRTSNTENQLEFLIEAKITAVAIAHSVLVCTQRCLKTDQRILILVWTHSFDHIKEN